MRTLSILSALLAPSSGHFGAGRARRGLVWIALLLASAPLTVWTGPWPTVLVYVAQAIDAGRLQPDPSRGAAYHLGWGLGCWLILAAGVVMPRAWVVENLAIPAASMSPTLDSGDHIVPSEWPFTPRRGDLVVFSYPRDPDKTFIKRVAAVGGDTIEIRDDTLVVNGQPLARTQVGACEYDERVDGGRWEPSPPATSSSSATSGTTRTTRAIGARSQRSSCAGERGSSGTPRGPTACDSTASIDASSSHSTYIVAVN